MKKPVRNCFTLLAIPLVMAWGLSGTPSQAETVPRARAYDSYTPEHPRAAPTKPGETAQHIDTYTSGKMPLKPLQIPAEVMSKLGVLAPEQLAFLKSGKSETVIASEQMFARIRKSTSAEDLKAYIDAIASVYAQVQFHPGKDVGKIALNTDSPSFNKWRLRRPQGLDPKREPGPLSLSRYVGGGAAFPTFAGSPVAFTPEDLKAGKVDVAIMGAPLNMGSGWRDADHAPTAMRLDNSASGTDVFSMLSPGQVLNIVDYGDVAIDQLSTERSVQEVRRVVREVAQAGSIPFIIGGDHSLEYPNVAAMADVYGKGNVGVIHFDSHLDTGRGRVHLLDHGQPIYRVMKEGHIRP
ncbi:MAG TPA: arginase family protein, partial [Rhizomicrobium sp.]|nr:arginase family protein [Rhizomicrobium sp.]